MKEQKIEVGDYFCYKKSLIGRIKQIEIIEHSDFSTATKLYVETFNEGWHWGDDKWFCIDSEIYVNCIFGKSLDELWVRMI